MCIYTRFLHILYNMYSFCGWLLWLSVCLCFIQVVVCNYSSFVLIVTCYSSVRIYYTLFSRLLMGTYMGCFSFGLTKQSVYHHICTCLLVNICKHFFWVHIQECNCWIRLCAYVQLAQMLSKQFPKWLYQFILSSPVHDSSGCFPCLFLIWSLFKKFFDFLMRVFLWFYFSISHKVS